MIGSVRRLASVVAATALAAGALVALGATPASAADPLGYMIAQGEGECWLASIDLVTAETTRIGDVSPDQCAFDLEFTPDGQHLLGTRVVESDGQETAILVEFDLATGEQTLRSQLGDFNVGGPGQAQGNITITPGGSFYTYLVPGGEVDAPSTNAVDPACDGSAFCLFSVDPANPTAVTYVNSVPQFETIYYGLATSCAGATVSARGVNDDSETSATWPAAGAKAIGAEALTSVNLTATGPGTTDIGPITEDTFVNSLDFDTAGTLYGIGFDVAHGSSLFTIDPATGATTWVNTFNDGTDPINVGSEGFAVAHPCSAPTPPGPPAAEPLAAIAPRFTG